MERPRTLREIMTDRGLDVAGLSETAGLDRKVVEAIVEGRYTTSPHHRQRLADAVDVSEAAIRWGAAVGVHAMYGHGPQFGRSP